MKIEKQQWEVEINHKKIFIHNIIWISPYAKSVRYSNQVKSIVGATTFIICKSYCLIFPSEILLNTSIILGIMIFTTENSQNCDLMLCYISEKTQFQLEKNISINRFRKNPSKIYKKKHNIEKYSCHRNIIVYYGANSSIFRFVSKLINVDFDEFKLIFFNSILFYLKNSQNEKHNNEMIKFFKKMGLNYIDKRIEIENND